MGETFLGGSKLFTCVRETKCRDTKLYVSLSDKDTVRDTEKFDILIVENMENVLQFSQCFLITATFSILFFLNKQKKACIFY